MSQNSNVNRPFMATAVTLAALTCGLLAAAPAQAQAQAQPHATTVTQAGLGPMTIASEPRVEATGARPAGVPGFDVYELSKNAQTSADFVRAKGLGAEFVYVKASGGVKVTNAKFATQFTGAKAAGLLVGTYHLAYPSTGTGAQQAAWFIGHGGQWQAGGAVLPPMLDLEKPPAADVQSGFTKACYGMTPTQLVAWIDAFSASVTASPKVGRAPILYVGPDFMKECLPKVTTLSAYQLFAPDYSGDSTPMTADFANSWATYSFWQYSQTEDTPLPGDQDVYNGTLQSLRLLADPAYGKGTVASSRNHDYDGDGKADVLTRTGGGTMQLQKGNGAGAFPTLRAIASGTQVYTAIVAPGDMNGDGVPDLYVRTSGGTMSFRAGLKGGGFASTVTAAITGANSLVSFAGVGDFTGDGKADLVALDTKGVLWLYVGNGTGTFSKDMTYGANGLATRVQLASGWSGVVRMAGLDGFTGPGSHGLMAQTSGGTVSYYPRTASGFGGRTTIGTGWNVYDAVMSPGDVNGDGIGDILVRTKATGQISIYRGTGKGTLAGVAAGAKGWSPYNWIG